MKIVITGLGASGKSSLFSACTGTEMKDSTSKTMMGVVNVPDSRLDKLSAMFNPKKTVFTNIDFVDAAALDTQAKQDRIQLFDTLRTADALVCVVGAYRQGSAAETVAELDKLRLEILINDLDMAMKRAERLEKDIKIAKNKAEKAKELELVTRIQPVLEAGKFLYKMDFDKDELAILNNFSLLSRKPCIYVINIADSLSVAELSDMEAKVKQHLEANSDPSPVILLNASLEAEIAVMDEQERAVFLQEYGIEECGRDRLIKAAYGRLNLVTFFTVGEDECRSWKIASPATAVDAAGAIHSDLARGFIRAEVVESSVLLELGSMQEAKKAGKLRLEGKTYEVKDGDIVHIMFNV